ncbi:dihydropteroate synthase [Nocardioides limicola]|uniref:dihydropteroate synthase n=1 Tax=Nocardioides limicola TaxID=2803368 RepID=UPI00193C50F2|nr:dihydropteroate synthase [Nocardioides sp. DJM-14]
MISLSELARLHDEHRSELTHPVATVDLPHGVRIGDEQVTVMGTVNLSKDSTYRESIAPTTASAIRLGRVQIAQGAAIVDLGAESSATHAARVSPQAQQDALIPVVEALAAEAVVSVETYHPSVVEACLAAGARVLNMTGRDHEEEMLTLAAEYDAAVVLCYGEAANVRETSEIPLTDDPVQALLEHFGPRLERARELGVERVVIDPGMGFQYRNLTDPHVRVRHQANVLLNSFRLRPLAVPVCTVLPHSLDVFEAEFRKAEGFFAVLASLAGVQLLRVHEVAHIRAVLHALAVLNQR